MLSDQIPSNPLRDPGLTRRFANLIIEFQIDKSLSDKQLANRLREVTEGRRGTENSILRWKNAEGGIPSAQVIGDMQKALDIPKERIQRLLYPNERDADVLPSLEEYNSEWSQVVAYLNRQTNLAIEISRNQKQAADALKNDDPTLARKYLMEIEKNASFSADYYSEQHANALASLGSLSIAMGDFEDAVAWYERAIEQRGIARDRLNEYRRSLRLAIHALMGNCHNEKSCRKFLNKMVSLNVYRTERTYQILIRQSETINYAKCIFDEMERNKISPSRISFHTLLKKCDNRKEFDECAEFLIKRYNHYMSDDSICIALQLEDCFEDALQRLRQYKQEGYFTGRASYEAAFMKPITSYTAVEILDIYFSMPFKFKTSLSNPIKQYIDIGDVRSAFQLSLVSPSLEASQKLYRDNYGDAIIFFDEMLKSKSENISRYFENHDIRYAMGIARLLNRDFKSAIADLKFAQQGTEDETRKRYISEIVKRARRGIVNLYVKKTRSQ